MRRPGSIGSTRTSPVPGGAARTVLALLPALAAAVGLVVTAIPAPRLAGEAWAHAALVRSAPAARATISRSPARVELWFNERLEPAFSSLSVHDGDGQQLDLRDVRVGPDDVKQLSVGVPTLTPGTYRVRYRVLSVDGHIVESEFTFTLRPPR